VAASRRTYGKQQLPKIPTGKIKCKDHRRLPTEKKASSQSLDRSRGRAKAYRHSPNHLLPTSPTLTSLGCPPQPSGDTNENTRHQHAPRNTRWKHWKQYRTSSYTRTSHSPLSALVLSILSLSPFHLPYMSMLASYIPSIYTTTVDSGDTH
jgi:hypothetical protein